jgi:hypothetical protein
LLKKKQDFKKDTKRMGCGKTLTSPDKEASITKNNMADSLKRTTFSITVLLNQYFKLLSVHP